MIVTTKAELEKAQKLGVSEIIIEGELAEKVRNGRKITTVGKLTLVVLVGAIGAIPFTGGMSAAAFAPIAALTGLEIALLMAIAFVGLGLLSAIWKEYDEVEFSYNPLRLKLKKKS
jgi:Na+/glutamate symporter